MSTRDRRPTAPDADADETTDELGEAEAAAAEAEARAEAARARAERIRQQAKAATTEDTGDADAAEDSTEDSAEGATENVPDPGEPTTRRRRLRLPSLTTVGVATLVVVLAGALTAIGFMAWQHRISAREDQRTAEVAAAARENTQVMMTLDHANAQANVQRVIDHSTGKFKDQYQAGAKDLVADLEKSKVVTRVTVTDVAVESVTADSTVALVAARTEGTNAEGAPQQPQLWRIAMKLSRDGGQLKIADVEFVQ